MRKFVLILSLFLLSGCSILNMPRYNFNEHLLVNKIRTYAEVNAEECKDSVAMASVSKELYFMSVELLNYNNLLSYNEETIKMNQSLVNITKGLKEKYNMEGDVNEEYCKIKMMSIKDASKTIQYVTVRKPK